MAESDASREGRLTPVDAKEQPFELTGGRLCLDLANTLNDRAADAPRELLNSYGGLVDWGRQAGILTEGEAARLVQFETCHPAEAASVLNRAIALREVIYRTFSAVAGGRSPEEADLAGLNAALAEALSLSRIVPMEGRFVWDSGVDQDSPDGMLCAVARSAGDLLTSEELDRVRICDGHDCLWLFMDTSRNRSRRWCDMKSCGNRAKAREHYQRKKARR